MPVTLINPLDERQRQSVPPAPRLGTLAGRTLGLLDISKPGGSVFLDRLSELLTARYGVARVVRQTKPTFTRPAPEAVLDNLRGERVDAVIEALAD